MFNSLRNDIRWVLIVAAAIVAAIIIWHVVAFVTMIVFKVVEFAILAALIYLVFLLARSALRNKRQQSA